MFLDSVQCDEIQLYVLVQKVKQILPILITVLIAIFTANICELPVSPLLAQLYNTRYAGTTGTA